jgi:hypothetical protein
MSFVGYSRPATSQGSLSGVSLTSTFGRPRGERYKLPISLPRYHARRHDDVCFKISFTITRVAPYVDIIEGGPKEARLRRVKLMETGSEFTAPHCQRAWCMRICDGFACRPSLRADEFNHPIIARITVPGRYFEAAIARGEKPEDIDNMHSLRVDNLFRTSEAEIRKVRQRASRCYASCTSSYCDTKIFVRNRACISMPMCHLNGCAIGIRSVRRLG